MKKELDLGIIIDKLIGHIRSIDVCGYCPANKNCRSLKLLRKGDNFNIKPCREIIINHYNKLEL